VILDVNAIKCFEPDERRVAELDLLVEGHVLVLDETLLLEVLVTLLFLLNIKDQFQSLDISG